MYNSKTLLSIAALLAITPSAMADRSPRQHILMDANWRFSLDKPTHLNDAKSITTWRWRQGEPADQATVLASTTDGAEWNTASSGDDVFKGRIGFAWFVTTLPAGTIHGTPTLHFASVDDNATVFVNGKLLTHHEGWNDPFDVNLGSAWIPGGPNKVAVLVENTAGGGGITGDVTLGANANPTTSDPSKPGLNDARWRTVHLPHDFVVEGKFSPTADPSHGSLPSGNAWYRKTFDLPSADKGKDLWLDFDGVYRDSTVYLNGVKLGEHPCGYTPFKYDISRAAHYGGKNVLAVSVKALHEEGWWYEGGGIYRHVWLNVANPVHVAPWGSFVTTKMAEPGADGIAGPAVVSIKTTVADGDSGQPYSVASTIFDPAGHAVGTIKNNSTATNYLVQHVPVPKPILWSIDEPQLYRAHTEIMQHGKVIDAVDTNFGIRTIRFDPAKGFFLNGQSVKIKGTCNHQDFAGVGVAMPDSLLYWRIKKLKEMGSNAYRMSHNPPTSELLDACDKLGMLVMDENRHLGDTEDGKASDNTPYADLHEVQSMVLRDRNHPSIIMWSMCNEEGIAGDIHGETIFAAMKKAVDAVDGTRPVTCAMNGGYFSPDSVTNVEDLQGINYSPGNYDRFHELHPNMPLYGSETASTVSTRGEYSTEQFTRDGVKYWGPEAQSYVSAYDVNAPGWAQTAEAAWQPIADRPFVAGGFVWTGFDYKGEPTPYGWPCINSDFGILDECGFPKDNFYYYQSVWGNKPVVHILPHWNWAGKEGQPITVWVYSNAANVELSLNGTSLGTKAMPKNGHLEWMVPYVAGTLSATGTDAQGKVIATDKVETTGEPTALKLSTDRKQMNADGEDVTMVEVDIVDAKGRIVPDAAERVTFTVTGAGHVTGVGNGDPTDHDPDKANTRLAFHGKCMVIVGAGETAGDIHLTADAAGLTGANMNFTTK